MDKQAVRERVWDELEDRGEARFPFPPHGRIPNFAGAETAADRLQELPEWTAAEAIKANPDAPQLPVRRAALHSGKTVYMAVPRLRDPDCFIRLVPAAIDDLDSAATVSSAQDMGEQVAPETLAPIDLIAVGSVAVTPDGDRIGKGEGYSDLEYALLREFDLVDDDTPTVTTVHECQVRETGIEADAHDVPLDWIVTPDRTIETEAGAKPDGIDWANLDEERRADIPVLERLAPE